MIFEFAYWGVLIGLVILVPLILFFLYAKQWKERRESTFVFSAASLVAKHHPGWKAKLDPFIKLLPVASLILLGVALARPQTQRPDEVDVEGIDIYLALDMSGSMAAIDLDKSELRELLRVGKQPENRFESAVDTLRGFIKTRNWDRIGMVVFAKDSFLQFPLTLDRSTILSMLERLKLGDINEGGTAIGNALGRSVSGLKDSDAKTKIVILITDGDRRGGNISPNQATEMAKQFGIKIYPILVGRDGNALVPRGRDIFSNQITYGETRFPVNPELLKEIASNTGGSYYRATDKKGLQEDLHEILNQFEKSRIRDATNVDPNEGFRPFVILALFLASLAIILQNTIFRKYP